jgi:hypothetical protein
MYDKMMPDSYEKLLQSYGWDTEVEAEEWYARHREELFLIGQEWKREAELDSLVEQATEIVIRSGI